MKKISKVSLTMLVLTLGIFVVAGTASANCVCDPGTVCGAANSTHYVCGEVVTSSCTFNAPLTCPVTTTHGLIIGAANITIDGNGYTLDGTTVVGRDCSVATYEEGVSDRLWGFGHPCRCAGVDSVLGQCTGCNDSGIFNAKDPGAAGSGCNANALTCQGGCDNVTVKNLTITNFCNGIFMSGDCASDANQRSGAGLVSDATSCEYRLTGLLIEGNTIHDCGKPDCGAYTESTSGDGGDWANNNYNDGIFLAQVGINATARCTATDEFFPDCEECVKGDTECPDLVKKGDSCVVQDSNRNIVRHNKIYNQKGCGAVAAPGGNGIDLLGGLELVNDNGTPTNEDDDWFEGVWAGCNEIAKNLVKDCDMSGIMYTHTTTYNRIHGNVVTANLLGGITCPCGWCNDTYIYDNVLEQNDGTAIAVNATAKIKNNICVETHAVPANSELRNMLGYAAAMGGKGILCMEAGSELVGNTVCCNKAKDIHVMGPVGSATGDQNKCINVKGNYTDSTAGPAGNPCRYTCCKPFFSMCTADMNFDCQVSGADFALFTAQWGFGGGPFDPPCCNP